MITSSPPLKPRRRSRTMAGERRLLIQTILELPRATRDVFLLNRMAGLPYHQISEVLGIDRDHVQSQLTDTIVQISKRSEMLRNDSGERRIGLEDSAPSFARALLRGWLHVIARHHTNGTGA
jgi:hypothetical protein